MESTIGEPGKSLIEMPLRSDIHKDNSLDHYYRNNWESEIKTPLAASMRDAAILVIGKRNNAAQWESGQMPSGEVYDDFYHGGVSERINGLEVNVAQRRDGTVSVEISDFTSDSPNNCSEITLLDTNSRHEPVAFLPDHSIYERMGVTKDEFAILVTERLSGMANKIDLQSSIQQESTVATSSVQVANENTQADLLPQNPLPAATGKDGIESVSTNSVATASTSTWMESLKAQIGNVEGSKLQVFSGNNKVYEQTNNVVTTDKLATPVGEKVQQALENPNELKGSVRVLVDGEKVYHAKNGQVLEDKHSLTLENPQVPQEKILNVASEVTQVSEVQKQSLPVSQEKSVETIPEVAQVAQVQEQVLQTTQVKSLEPVVLDVSPVVENKTNTNSPGLDEFYSSASFDSSSGRQIFSVPLDYNQPKLDERIPNQATPVEAKTEEKSSLNEPQPHRPPCQIFSVPLDCNQPKLDENIQKVVAPVNVTKPESLEQALALANARINALQAQLDESKKSLENLSKYVHDNNIKSWANNKAQEITKASQSIVEQAKSKVTQWMQAANSHIKEVVDGVKSATQNKVDEVKSATQNKVDEVKSATQNKVNEVKEAALDKVSDVKIAAVLKGIEIRESVREQANKFLAPVNSAQVERAAKHIVCEFGDGKSYNKAATHSFQLNDKNELSIARQADGAVIYEKGQITKAANSRDILKLNVLPDIVAQIKEKQMQSAAKQQMEVGG